MSTNKPSIGSVVLTILYYIVVHFKIFEDRRTLVSSQGLGIRENNKAQIIIGMASMPNPQSELSVE